MQVFNKLCLYTFMICMLGKNGMSVFKLPLTFQLVDKQASFV